MWFHIQEEAEKYFFWRLTVYLLSVFWQWWFAWQPLEENGSVWTNQLVRAFSTIHTILSILWIAYLLIGKPIYHRPLLSSKGIQLSDIESCKKDMEFYDKCEWLMWSDMIFDTLQWFFNPDVNQWASLPLFVTALLRWLIYYSNRKIYSSLHVRLLFENRFAAFQLKVQESKLAFQAFKIVFFIFSWTLVCLLLTLFPVNSSSTPSFQDRNSYDEIGWVMRQRAGWTSSWWGMLALVWVFALEDHSCLQQDVKHCIPTFNTVKYDDVYDHVAIEQFFTWVTKEATHLLAPLDAALTPWADEMSSAPRYWRGLSTRHTYLACVVLGTGIAVGSWLWVWMSGDAGTPSYASYFTILGLGGFVASCLTAFFLVCVLPFSKWSFRYVQVTNGAWLILAWSWIPLQFVQPAHTYTLWEWMAWSSGGIILPLLWLLSVHTTLFSESLPSLAYARWLGRYHVTKFYSNFIERDDDYEPTTRKSVK